LSARLKRLLLVQPGGLFYVPIVYMRYDSNLLNLPISY